MSDLINKIGQQAFNGNGQGVEKQLQNTNQNRSFENVMQQTGDKQTQTGQTAPTNSVQRADDPRLQQMQMDLTQRLQNVPNGVSPTTAVFPEYLTTKTKMSDFRNILSKAVGSVGSLPQGSNVKERFTQVESEWNNIQSVMQSNKELSQGELLGLQARMYQVSQHVDVLSKVVDQMSSGVKQILNTNV